MKVVKLAAVGLIILAVGFVIYVNTTNQYPKYLENNKLFESVASRLSVKDATNDPRLAAWQIGLKAVEAKPLLGYGPENFAVGFDKYYNPSIPNLSRDMAWYDKAHNIIIQTGSDAGILGILAYLFLFVILFLQLQKLKNPYKSEKISINQRSIIAHGIQATLIGYFVANLFSFDSFSTYLIFFLLIGYSLHLTSSNDAGTKPAYAQASAFVKTTARQAGVAKKAWWKPTIIIILFLLLIIFLWQYNFVPLQINAKINNAQDLANQKQCDQAFSTMDKILPEHSFLDSYTRMEYVEFEKTCAVFYPENNLAYTKKGAELIKEAVKIQPLYTRYWLFLGTLTTTLAEQQTDPASENKMLLEADGYLDKALQLAPKHQEIFIAKAKIQIDEGNYENAKTDSEKCVALYSGLGDCYFNLGLSEIYLKDNSNADKNMQTAALKGYDVNSETSLVELGNAYGSANALDYQNLAIIFEKLIAITPNSAQYHSTLAFCYAKLGEYDKARQEAAMVIQLSPQSKDNVDEFLKTLPMN
jgi:Flp pilus assembly protein TadD